MYKSFGQVNEFLVYFLRGRLRQNSPSTPFPGATPSGIGERIANWRAGPSAWAFRQISCFCPGNRIEPNSSERLRANLQH
jgi:hypothetical protein